MPTLSMSTRILVPDLLETKIPDNWPTIPACHPSKIPNRKLILHHAINNININISNMNISANKNVSRQIIKFPIVILLIISHMLNFQR